MTGEQLRHLRFQAGYSTKGFAALIGLKDARNLRRWEAGSRPIPAPIVAKILDVLLRDARARV